MAEWGKRYPATGLRVAPAPRESWSPLGDGPVG
jgi:hypothetical protein